MESRLSASARVKQRNMDGRLPSVVKRKFLEPSKNMDHLLCKICLQVYWEPFSTLCGHTFCRSCIEPHLAQQNRCPICEVALDPKKTRIIPNYTVAALVGKILLNDASEFHRVKKDKMTKMDCSTILDLLVDANLDMAALDRISGLVETKRLEMEVNEEFLRNILLYEFLEKMIEKHERKAELVQSQLIRLRSDKEKVGEYLSSQMPLNRSLANEPPKHLHPSHHQQQHNQRLVPDVAAVPPATTAIAPPVDMCDQSSLSVSDVSISAAEISLEDSRITGPPTSENGGTGLSDKGKLGGSVSKPLDFFSVSMSQRVRDELNKYRKRLLSHMGSLEQIYFNARNDEGASTSVGSCTTFELKDFTQMIQGMSQYGNMKRLATLNYNSQAQSPHSIVSSIEFDKDGEYFAVAGVTRLIKIYDFNLVVEFNGDNPYPVQQLQCGAKISNVSWNPYSKNLLASSDYDGIVQLWDTNVGKATRTLREHERRCWTVQFNNVDPHLMASGSDDSKVKLWNVMMPQSICSIDAKANVCAVNFSPQSKNHLVFGSADHCVHLYDIRNTSKALSLFCGHRKAVSYVKYCNESEVVSASIDGDLRIWNVHSYKCMRTLRGHQNERNFVGLATDGNHVMCGSESNHLYLYYKNISDPLMLFDFNSNGADSVLEPHPDLLFDDRNANAVAYTPDSNKPLSDFVSAICWKKNSNVVVAANSQGTTHILQLQ